jgi:twitching motility protein PilT
MAEEKKEQNEATKTNTTTGIAQGIGNVQIQQLFKVMVDNGASDLHLTVGSQPAMRIHGEIVRVKVGSLTGEDTKKLVYQILTQICWI